MSVLVKLNDEEITSDFLIKYLKISGQFEEIMEKLLSERITVHIARDKDITVSDEEVQEHIDQLRRILGLHRAKDTLEYIETLGFTVDEYGEYIREDLMRNKMLNIVCSEGNIEEYFKLNSPKFDTVQLRHILVTSEGQARELVALLEDDPESFDDMAREHSLAMDTARSGGSLGPVTRGVLSEELEAKVFNAAAGDILGPFESGEGLTFEIFKVDEKRDAELNAKTSDAIALILQVEWIKARLGEHQVEIA